MVEYASLVNVCGNADQVSIARVLAFRVPTDTVKVQAQGTLGQDLAEL